MKRLRVIFVLPLLLFSFSALAQNKVVSGKVTDSKNGQPLAGASVLAKGTKIGTQTLGDGTFKLNAPSTATSLVITSVGYNEQEVTIGDGPITVSLVQSNTTLSEVVVVGYGTARKKDLTGSVVAVTAKDFNKAPVITPEQLITGKVAGVQITSNGGAPGSGSRIRIRSGASLNASNEPLIVIDGVPMQNARNPDGTSAISGVSDPLSLINPNDIESFNVLKDASATAIYGSRASNGVIIITTKKGTGGKFRINFNTTESLSTIDNQVDVLSAAQFRDLVKAQGTEEQIALLGDANTNWQDEIYQTAFTTDNNLSFSGGIKNLPYRLSLEYLNQDGNLKTDNLQRTSARINLNPKFFDNHLSVNLNVNGSINKSRFADKGAIGSATFFDPTHPVYGEKPDYDKFGGYFEWLDGSGNPNTQAPRNPVSMLEQRENKATVKRSIGNLQLDYKFHFLPELRANVNLGYDVSKTEGTNVAPATLASVYTLQGTSTKYSQERTSKLFEGYLNYVNEFAGIRSRVDVTGGYSYQDWITSAPAYPTINGNGSQTAAGNPSKTQNTLISFFGRLNYSYDDKYLFTGTVRRDGSSRFNPDNQWGTFPSAALAWRISKESFLQNAKALSDLKLRVSYGVTGQQDILGNDYPYLARYSISDSSARYLLGTQYIPTLRPAGYDANIKWEETHTWDIGVDYGFLNGRISGSIEYYFKKTKDLLAIVAVPAGSNFSNRVLTNVGNMENRGIEFVINATPVRNNNFSWDANFNITWSKSKITNLSKVKDTTSIGIETGGIGGGVGNTIQIHSLGYNPFAFYVYKQVYDKNDNPIEGVYVDLNKDGIINQNDKYRYKSPEPKVYLGFSSQFAYKQWSLAFTMRAQFGNYMYNNFNSNNGTYTNFQYPNYLGNVSSIVLKTNFTGDDSYRYWSDYFIENASFLKMDNINIAYNFGKLGKHIGLRVSGTVQNVFAITEYTGLDPEVAGGIDNNFYPRPRIFSLGASLDF